MAGATAMEVAVEQNPAYRGTAFFLYEVIVR